jgi:hypothetical protein
MWSALSDERSGLWFTVAAGPRQRGLLGAKSRGTRDHILLPILRLLQPGGPLYYFPQEQGSPVTNLGTGLGP